MASASQRRLAACLFAAGWMVAAQAAAAADIVGLGYDAQADELVLDIAYRGSHARHDFEVQWGPCSRERKPYETVGRVLDVHGRDTAEESFVVRERIGLHRLPCRPAQVTLRLGLRSHASVFVPAGDATGLSVPDAPGRAAGRAAAAGPDPAENRGH